MGNSNGVIGNSYEQEQKATEIYAQCEKYAAFLGALA
jgi:hypothetical protein